ncbi:MAG: Sec-independent protein translocase protein TatB [Sulfurifustis sp.]
MFDVGFSELVVVALVALIVLGPKRLPEVARTAGQWVARFRRFVADVKSDFDRELEHADLQELRKLKQELDDTRRLMEETSSKLVQQAQIEPTPPSAAVNPLGTTSAPPAEPAAPTAAPAPAAAASTAASPAAPAPGAAESAPAAAKRPRARRPRKSANPAKPNPNETSTKDPNG